MITGIQLGDFVSAATDTSATSSTDEQITDGGDFMGI